MDSEDEAICYFKLMNDSSGNSPIQNNYELQDCLSEEPIFTEIETGTWSTEAFPILLNNSSENEGINVKGKMDNKIEREQGLNVCKRTSKFYCPISCESLDIISQKGKDKSSSSQTQGMELSQYYLTQDGTITMNITHENQLETKKKAHLINGNTYESTYSNDNSLKSQCLNKKENPGNKIDVLGRKESSKITEYEEQEHNFSTEDFSNDFMDSENSVWNEFHCIITARKCKVCSFLCESLEEITCHLKDVHADLIKLKEELNVSNSDNNVEPKMKSLLDANNKSILSNTTIFVCSMCDNNFTTKKLLMHHLKTHNGENKSESDKTELMTNAQNETSRNSVRKLAISLLKNQQRSMKKLKCSVDECNLKFSDNESKLQHQKCHVPNGKYFQCFECKESFSVWRLCSKHLWSCHKIDAGLYTCPTCNNYKSNSPVLIMNHMDIHNYEKPFLCTKCGKGFKQLSQFRNHKMIHDRELSSPSSKMKCTICERFFANKKSLKKHKETVHDKIKPFICNLCGHKTSRKSILELHYRRHTGEKPHHCPHCTYKASDHNCLRRHVMIHFSNMKYFCPYCEYQAIQSTAYKNHLNTKHPGAEEIFKCGYCTFTCLNFDSYLTHIKCHEHEHKMKGRKENNPVAVNTDEAECDDFETQIDLYVPNKDDYLEDIEDDENIDEPSAYVIQD